MALLFLGFGGYFFYDATIGYPAQNKTFCIYKTFVKAGAEFTPDKFTPESWKAHVSTKLVDFSDLPIPENTDRTATPWPSELADYTSLNDKGWNNLWVRYSERNQLPYKAPEQALNQGKIQEQWIAGGTCCAIFLYCLFLLIRTMSRRMSINGTDIVSSGKTFDVQDITLIDMRKWKNKGLARATALISGKETAIRFDGLTYGGFDEAKQPNTAENFMQSLLSVYKGEILDYEENTDSDDKQEPRSAENATE